MKNLVLLALLGYFATSEMSVNAIQIRSFEEPKKEDAKAEAKEEEKKEEKKEEKAEEKKAEKEEEKKEPKKDEKKDLETRDAAAGEADVDTKKKNDAEAVKTPKEKAADAKAAKDTADKK